MTTSGYQLPDPELVDEMRRAIRRYGVKAAAAFFGVHTQSALTIAAGAMVRRGTLALVREQRDRRKGR